MSGLAFLTLAIAIIFVGLLIWLLVDYFRYGYVNFEILPIIVGTLGVILFAMSIFSISQPISMRAEMARANLEREQIHYQIALVEEDPTKEKVKLNEWILTYNDWVNDINVEKEIYGWFAWHYNFDMSEHTYISLV